MTMNYYKFTREWDAWTHSKWLATIANGARLYIYAALLKTWLADALDMRLDIMYLAI